MCRLCLLKEKCTKLGKKNRAQQARREMPEVRSISRMMRIINILQHEVHVKLHKAVGTTKNLFADTPRKLNLQKENRRLRKKNAALKKN